MVALALRSLWDSISDCQWDSSVTAKYKWVWEALGVLAGSKPDSAACSHSQSCLNLCKTGCCCALAHWPAELTLAPRGLLLRGDVSIGVTCLRVTGVCCGVWRWQDGLCCSQWHLWNFIAEGWLLALHAESFTYAVCITGAAFLLLSEAEESMMNKPT